MYPTRARILVLTMLCISAGVVAADEPQHDVPPAAESQERWLLHHHAERHVVFKGIADMDSAGLGTGSILYPGDSAVGFLAAVFTHAAIADSAQDKQKAELQAEADKVLIPYRPALQSFSYDDLVRAAATMMTTEGDKEAVTSVEGAADGWLVLSDPVFSMTADQQAIVLNGTVRIYAPGQRERPAYQNYVRVVSLPAGVQDPVAHWTDADGGALKQTSASLFARALDAAIADAGGENAGSDRSKRTFRYREGGIERIERAQLLRADCDRMLLRTLRGHLYLVPVTNTPASSSVTPDAACSKVQAQTDKPPAAPSS